MARTASATQDRRRRVLSEQMKGAETESIETEKPESGVSASAYARQSLDEQPRISDFVPRNLTTIALVTASLGLVAGGIVTLRLYAAEISPWVDAARLVPITATGAGSFSAWFSSLIFGLATLVCFATYSIRRHRTDDYQGRYRIWRTAGFAWLLAGLSVSTGLHLAVGDALVRLANIDSARLASIAWLVPVAIVLGPVLIRVLLELRECRFALTVLVAAHLAWLAASVVGEGLIQIDGHGPVIAMSCLLAGQVLLLTALLLNSRHVLLQTLGEIPAPPRTRVKAKAKTEKKKREEALAKSASDARAEPATNRSEQQQSNTKTEPAHEEPRQPAISRQTISSPRQTPQASDKDAQDDRWTDGDESGDFDPPLSKAERKRLRKQQAREQRAARR